LKPTKTDMQVIHPVTQNYHRVTTCLWV